jgi:hypothetical protein
VPSGALGVGGLVASHERGSSVPATSDAVARTEAARRSAGQRTVTARLVARPVTVDLGGRIVDTWGYGDAVPGPPPGAGRRPRARRARQRAPDRGQRALARHRAAQRHGRGPRHDPGAHPLRRQLHLRVPRAGPWHVLVAPAPAMSLARICSNEERAGRRTHQVRNERGGSWSLRACRRSRSCHGSSRRPSLCSRSPKPLAEMFVEAPGQLFALEEREDFDKRSSVTLRECIRDGLGWSRGHPSTVSRRGNPRSSFRAVCPDPLGRAELRISPPRRRAARRCTGDVLTATDHMGAPVGNCPALDLGSVW